MLRLVFVSSLLLSCLFASAQVNSDTLTFKTDSLRESQASTEAPILYRKPKPFEWLTKLPRTFAVASKISFQKKSIPAWCGIVGSSLILIAADQDIRNGITHFADYIGLDSENKYKTIIGFKVGSTQVDAYQMPRNLNSVFYSLGEGSTSLLLSGGLSIFGHITHDNRSRQTSSQIMQSQLALGITCQILKRAFGRESPDASKTQSGGVWRPFTKPSEYQKKVSKHDAFPSGHLATMMATLVVIADNYPEKRWIRPVGYSLIGLTGFAMVNNGVHWVGDYPLALGIGYVCGKAAVKLNGFIKKKQRRK